MFWGAAIPWELDLQGIACVGLKKNPPRMVLFSDSFFSRSGVGCFGVCFGARRVFPFLSIALGQLLLFIFLFLFLSFLLPLWSKKSKYLKFSCPAGSIEFPYSLSFFGVPPMSSSPIFSFDILF